MTISQSIACQRLSSLGLNQALVHSLVDLIQKWKNNEGSENTVTRLKAIKTAFLEKLGGQPVTCNWVAHTNDHVKGPFKPLFRAQRPKHIQRALSALMVYSAEVSPHVTHKQNQKFWSSVERGLTPQESLTIEGLQSKIVSWARHFDSNHQVQRLSSNTFKKMVIDKVYPQKGPLLDGHGSKEYTPADLKFLTNSRLLAAAREMFVDFPEPFVLACDEDLIAGRIGYIQEPGYKLRAIANPVPMYNWVLTPLKDHLLNVLRTIPEDCTHDQMKGVLWAQRQLKEGISLASVDLSDATNLFPWIFQRAVLDGQAPFTRVWAEALEALVHAQWLDPLTNTWRKWERGQPLGLGPSFPLFALSHHIVMRLIMTPSERETPNLYQILGDDIVMVSSLEIRYKSFMKMLGCDISEQKSITSDRLAEFASRVITTDYVYIQNKWRDFSDNNFLDLAKNLGPQSLGLLRPRQKRVVMALASLPEWEGGLGWNQEGLPIAERLDRYWSIKNALETDTSMPHRKVRAARWDPLLRSPFIVFDESGEQFAWRREAISNPYVDVKINNLDTKQVVLHNTNVLEEDIVEGEVIPGFIPSAKPVSDPRGRSSLDTLERKIGNLPEEIAKTQGVSLKESVSGDTTHSVLSQTPSEAINLAVSSVPEDTFIPGFDQLDIDKLEQILTESHESFD